MSDHTFAYSSQVTICYSNVLFLEKNSCISKSFLQWSCKTFCRMFFLTQLNAKPSLKNLPLIPKQLTHSANSA